MKVEFNLVNKIRIDQFLSNEIDSLSREKIKKLIKTNNVKIDGKIINKPNFILDKDCEIIINEVEEKTNEKLTLWDNFKAIDVIFENDNYLILNKPSGLVVHPGAGNTEKTLVNILITKYKNLPNNSGIRPGIVHRIDKNTSGVLVIAKTEKFYNHIQKQFETSMVEKEYKLITDGLYETKKGIINAPIGRDKKNRKLMDVTHHNSKEAKSIFRVEESFPKNEYVEFKILTGRTHQIRVHSRFVGAPILNDPEYGKKTFNESFGQFLHANKISFKDLNNNKVTYSAPLPKEFLDKLTELRNLTK